LKNKEPVVSLAVTTRRSGRFLRLNTFAFHHSYGPVDRRSRDLFLGVAEGRAAFKFPVLSGTVLSPWDADSITM
jgi:hypothetical protein